MSAGYRYCPRCSRPLELQLEGGVQRMRCADASCGFVHWDNPVPVVAAIVEHEGEVILARNALWPPRMFGLITGFLERIDPSPESGVLREVEEELGLKGELAGFIGHYPFERMNQLIIAFHVLARGEIRLSEELVAYKRVAPEKLRPWAAGTGYAVRDWLKARGITPPSEAEIVASIRDFHRIDARLAGSGQPDADEILTLRTSFDTIVNLAPADHPQGLPGEADLVRLVGLRYHHIPVVWDAPEDEDFARFCAVMDAEASRRVLVHCIANKRASSFLYLYRHLRQGVAEREARADLERVWQPNDVWTAFEARQRAKAAG
jgi:NAD+ diphosphatase